MILYDSPNPAPNPRRVRIFAAEKGVELTLEPVSLLAREHKSAEHLARNALGQTPVLVLDDGMAISESVAICRFLEAIHPAQPLFGTTPVEIGLVEMWIRRAELALGAPVRSFWVNAHPLTERVVPLRFPDFGHASVPQAQAAMDIFNLALAETAFIAGASFSMADIVLLTTIDFAGLIGIAMPDGLTNLRRWHEEVSGRPSAAA